MNPEAVRTLLAEAGAIMEGHFLLTSGRHSRYFVQCSQVLQYPDHTAALTAALAERLQPVMELRPTTVVGPALGGIVLAYEMARTLRARALYAEKTPGGMVFRRGFRLRPAETVLVVEDVVTTGGSVNAVIEAVRDAGAWVAGVGALVDRSGGDVGFRVPFASLLRLPMEDWDPRLCPLCHAGIALVRPKG